MFATSAVGFSEIAVVVEEEGEDCCFETNTPNGPEAFKQNNGK